VSAPVLLTKAPLAEAISRSENVDITLSAPSVRTASFAIAVEKGLNDRVQVEKKVLDYLDSHSAIPLPHCERVETLTGFALPPEPPSLTDGGKDMEHGGRTVLPDLGASDRGYPASRLLVAASGKSLPQPEYAGEKPAPFSRTPSPSDGAAEWESIALASSAAPGLDMATDELVRTAVSDHKAVKPAPPENGHKLTQTPAASVPYATPASNPHARREAARRFAEVVATVSDGTRASPSPSHRSSQTDERVEAISATQIDREGLAEVEPGKRIANTTRNNISQKPAHPEPHISPREHMHRPVLAQGEQHADPRPETAPAVGRTLQVPGGSASSPSASTLALAEVCAKQCSDGLGNQIRLMLHRQSPVVELKLNPPELQSLEVRIALDKDATNIQFIVHNLAAKDMLEDALPRLRTLLHDVGVNLQDVGVRERTSGEQQHNAHSGFAEDRDEEFTQGEGSSREQASKEFARPAADTTDRGIDAYA
jgi:flagellar hook-length control protein FliK